ncbi:MAG: hypothetical protein HFF44_05325 [Lawsonibacter sp.]|nr:hypothetical protein [Lawsonibacter sp.]
MLPAWMVILATFLTVLYGYKTQKRITPMALTFAFLIGCGVMGLPPKQLLSYAPLNVMFDIMAISFFFGFAAENGTLEAVTKRVVHRMRRVRALLLPAMFAVSYIVALSGAGISTPAFMAPIAFAICSEMALRPSAVYAAVACGAVAGSNFMYSGGGIVTLGLVAQAYDMDAAFDVTVKSFLISTVICLAFFLAVYVLQKGWKCKEVPREGEEPLTPVQKKTLLLLAAVVAVVILPPFAAQLTGNPLLSQLSRRLEVGFVMMAGGCTAAVLGLADDGKVLRFHVPWPTIVMLGSMSILIGVGREAGMVDLLAGSISDFLPRTLVAPALALAGGLMSVFSSAISVVLPTMFPMVPQLAGLTGLPPQMLFMAIFVSSTLTGTSPLSTMGSMTLGGCDRDEDRSRLFYQVILYPFLLLAIVVALFWGWSLLL